LCYGISLFTFYSSIFTSGIQAKKNQTNCVMNSIWTRLRKNKKFRIFIISVVLLFVLSIVSIWLANRSVQKAAVGKIYNDINLLPHTHCGLLLGTTKITAGRLNKYYMYRIDAAEQLLKSNKIDFLIVSGDNGTKEYDEPTTMIRDLIDRGIDSTRLFADYAGFRTLDSVVRSKEIFGQDSILIISQAFHNERAIYLANEFSIYAIGFNARDVTNHYGFKTILREKFARVKLFVDVVFGVKPKFLGEKITIP
jgi:SanA protein